MIDYHQGEVDRHSKDVISHSKNLQTSKKNWEEVHHRLTKRLKIYHDTDPKGILAELRQAHASATAKVEHFTEKLDESKAAKAESERQLALSREAQEKTHIMCEADLGI